MLFSCKASVIAMDIVTPVKIDRNLYVKNSNINCDKDMEPRMLE